MIVTPLPYGRTGDRIPPAAETAECYGTILRQLRKARTPIPTNGVWIAALALEQGALQREPANPPSMH